MHHQMPHLIALVGPSQDAISRDTHKNLSNSMLRFSFANILLGPVGNTGMRTIVHGHPSTHYKHLLLNVAFSPTGHTGVGQLLIGAS